MFIHLHAHSEYSWDGVNPVKQLVQKAQNAKMTAVALTDHHTVFSWFDLAEETRKAFIHPIYGMEINVSDCHITALAMNEMGLGNLITLNNLGYLNGGKPKVSEKEMMKHHEGIVFLSGCTKSRLQKELFKKEYLQALKTVRTYKELLGDRYYIEVQRYKESDPGNHVRALAQLAKKHQIPLIPTNDVHYLEKEDARIQDGILRMHTAGKIGAKGEQHYFKTEEQMEELFPAHFLQNTALIAERCRVDLKESFKDSRGTAEFPLSMVYRYDDKEALKKVLYGKGSYRLAEHYYKKMKSADLLLEDLSGESSIQEEVAAAYGIRGRVSSVQEDPYYYIEANVEKVPLIRKNKKAPYSVQMDYFAAQEMGFRIKDKRKTEVYAKI